jgi:gas vesicle protein
MSNNSKILLALLGGLAVGAAVGILFAPDKGSETRKKIKDSAEDLADKVKSKAKTMASDIKSEINKKVEDIYS